MRRARYTMNPALPPATADGSPDVRYGDFDDLPNGARLLPPCSPTKIVCVGRNYAEHARELGNEVPKEPLIFLKPPSSLIASGDEIVYPPISARVDFEGELGVVIGRRARNVKAGDALDYVLGYTCVNDVTARDLQKRDGQWTRGKGFDTFCPAGPCVILKNEANFDAFRIETFVDGERKQDGNPKDMLFPVSVIIEYVTGFMTLEPGDLIATGTPPGVGPMAARSIVEVRISGIGVLTNTVNQDR